MKIATWNVNSVRKRLPNVLDWLKSFDPDILLMQEIKTVDKDFPAADFESLGYHVAVHGQKAYNGVAIASKTPFEEVMTGLPGDDGDEQARYVEVVTKSGDKNLRVASIYLPNGNPTGSDKYPYKLAWMDRLKTHAQTLLGREEILVLGGDYNVIVSDGDVYDPDGWREDALALPQTREKFRALMNLGFTDALRSFHSEAGIYSFWDYQAGAWPKGNGLLIDHLLLSPQAADLLTASGIDRAPRGEESPSDHTPVWCELAL